MDLMVLGDQLDTYIIDLRGDDESSYQKVQLDYNKLVCSLCSFNLSSCRSN